MTLALSVIFPPDPANLKNSFPPSVTCLPHTYIAATVYYYTGHCVLLSVQGNTRNTLRTDPGPFFSLSPIFIPTSLCGNRQKARGAQSDYDTAADSSLDSLESDYKQTRELFHHRFNISAQRLLPLAARLSEKSTLSLNRPLWTGRGEGYNNMPLFAFVTIFVCCCLVVHHYRVTRERATETPKKIESINLMADPETFWLQGSCCAHHIRLYTGRVVGPPFYFRFLVFGMKKTYSAFNWMLYSRGLMVVPPKGPNSSGIRDFY